ncbi:MAG: DUF3987 domain-containing protein, partial [Geminicoccaceae bacterium]
TLNAECLPMPLYRYVEAEAERLNVDPCPLAAHVLSACASSITDAWHIRPKRHDHWTQQARLWSCVVKDVGARGTEMIRSAFWPVRERDKALFDEWRREHAAWRERQLEHKKSKAEGDEPEPKCRRLTTQDATIEAALLISASDSVQASATCSGIHLAAASARPEKGALVADEAAALAPVVAEMASTRPLPEPGGVSA